MLPWRLALGRVPAPMLAWARILHILLERGTIAGRRIRCVAGERPQSPQSTPINPLRQCSECWAGRCGYAGLTMCFMEASRRADRAEGCEEKKEGVVGCCKRADWRASMAGHPSNLCAQPSCMATVSKDNIYTRQNVIIYTLFSATLKRYTRS